MNIKYNKQKQELREDPLMDWLLKGKMYIKTNSNILMGAVIVILFVVGGIVVFNNMRASSQKKAQEVFGKAMIAFNDNQMAKAAEEFRIISENHSSSPQATFSAFMLGKILMDEGKYDEAITWFENAISGKETAGFVSGQALEGLAACYEAKGDIKSANEFMEKALKDARIQYRHAAIRWKMALLNTSADSEKSKKLCQEIIADTTANEYHQKAENLLAVLKIGSAG